MDTEQNSHQVFHCTYTHIYLNISVQIEIFSNLLSLGGEVGDFFLSPFHFLLIKFNYTFSISYLVLTCYVYYYCISLGFNELY